MQCYVHPPPPRLLSIEPLILFNYQVLTLNAIQAQSAYKIKSININTSYLDISINMDPQITDSEALSSSWEGFSKSPTPLFDDSMPLPPEAVYSSKDELYSSIQEWAARNGYAFTISKSKKIGLRTKVIYACDRRGKPPQTNQEEELQGRRRKRRTGSRKTRCLFSVTAVKVSSTR
jgi:hypothetical protein